MWKALIVLSVCYHFAPSAALQKWLPQEISSQSPGRPHAQGHRERSTPYFVMLVEIQGIENQGGINSFHLCKITTLSFLT